jgi:hypothetical protein
VTAVTYDDELVQDFIPITEADRPPPQGPPPSKEIVDAVWALVGDNERLLSTPGRLCDEVRERGLTVTRDQIRLALLT